MKKYSVVVACVLSACLGMVGAHYWNQIPVPATADAQEFAPRGPVGFAPPPAALAPPAAIAAGATLAAPQYPETEELTPEERVNISVYDKCNRSVVNINTKSVQVNFFLEVPTEGAGSGSVLDTKGHVLTNFHVVDGAQEIRVTLFNGKSYAAALVGQDPANDVAVLRIDAPADVLVPVEFGDSARLRVGQRVFALGNPFGLERTLTTGILSSMNRQLPSRSGRTMKQILQLDAALNRGNSGGPLLDSHGRLIGMNTAIASSTGENTGVGFAVPVNTIRRVVPQLLENGKVVRPDTGITRVYQTEQGLVVATMAPGGPAERAGLKGFRVTKQQKRKGPFTYEESFLDRSTADMIVAVDGERIKTADDFLTAIDKRRPSEDTVLTIVRDGREQAVRLTLGAGE